MKAVYFIFFTLILSNLSAQTKNFIDLPYIETSAKADTLIIPDKIYLSIILTENDSKIRKTTEHQEKQLIAALKKLQIDTEKDLSVWDMGSDFKKYFLKSQAIIKAKKYELLVKNAAMAGKVLVELEKIGISNIFIARTEYSQAERLVLLLKQKAIQKAKFSAETMAKTLSQKIGNAIFINDKNVSYAPLQGDVAGIRVRGIGKMEENLEDYPFIDFKKIKFEVFVEAKFKLE
ncbi:hypothetical protein CAPN004_19290 [Capnocytophaga cynodegmi]|uniref:SIMPL domain-containing protein n=1 Tax=Capnocytophaga cynodegmi TaxID=28189 RepID=UPI001ACA288E|nr:SIMPL domain-containing protein [Capnocytophaga cynodegmi]GIM52899.1 hypothetical protein CAPN004_19290 [Capnocytophaga cynodegmi]